VERLPALGARAPASGRRLRPVLTDHQAGVQDGSAGQVEAGLRETGSWPACPSIFALVDDRDRAYFGRRDSGNDEIGFIDAQTQAIFGRTYAAEPDVLIQQLQEDEAIAAADTLLLTVPNQLGVDYNAHVIDSILTHVAPALGWR
jgi:hypothetical protein